MHCSVCRQQPNKRTQKKNNFLRQKNKNKRNYTHELNTRYARCLRICTCICITYIQTADDNNSSVATSHNKKQQTTAANSLSLFLVVSKLQLSFSVCIMYTYVCCEYSLSVYIKIVCCVCKHPYTDRTYWMNELKLFCHSTETAIIINNSNIAFFPLAGWLAQRF